MTTEQKFEFRNCEVKFKCLKKWDDLEVTAVPSVRNCHECRKTVHYCRDEQELMDAILADQCVAFPVELLDGEPDEVDDPDWVGGMQMTEQYGVSDEEKNEQKSLFYLNMLDRLIDAGKPFDVQSIALEAIAEVGGSAALHNKLGTAYNDLLNRPDMAVQHFELALDMAPDDVAIMANLGISLVGLERFQDAAKTFERAIRAAPTYANAYINLAVAHYHLGDMASAEKCLISSRDYCDPAQLAKVEEMLSTMPASGENQ